MDWNKYGAYRIFDEFVETFFINRKSFITTHDSKLDVEDGFDKIHEYYIQHFDETKGKNFGQKLRKQFENADDNEKIIFTNLEYLWAMPVARASIRPETKRNYVSRWYKGQARTEAKYFFEARTDCVANPGMWNNQNKFGEICSLVYMMKELSEKSPSTVVEAKEVIGAFSYEWVYNPNVMKARFNIIDAVFSTSATQNFMLHFSNPDKFEAIVSDSHKNDIVRTFAPGLGIVDGDREQKIQAIKKVIFDQYANDVEADEKYRWFFYKPDVRSEWRGKPKKRTSKQARQDNAMISAEALGGFADEYSGEEGDGGEVAVVKIRKRDPKLVLFVKERDKYTCKSCGFWFEKRIVHVHHLDPLSEQKGLVVTKPADLITLCPNCHALAHDLLRDDNKYKERDPLLAKLGELIEGL